MQVNGPVTDLHMRLYLYGDQLAVLMYMHILMYLKRVCLRLACVWMLINGFISILV